MKFQNYFLETSTCRALFCFLFRGSHGHEVSKLLPETSSWRALMSPSYFEMVSIIFFFMSSVTFFFSATAFVRSLLVFLLAASHFYPSDNASFLFLSSSYCLWAFLIIFIISGVTITWVGPLALGTFLYTIHCATVWFPPTYLAI